jgi:2,3-bisphosphoglycerate-independent phosphoglycerate mutase
VVALLVILDGASEPVRAGTPTALERAATPALDELAHAGTLTRVRTVPAGLAPGSEVAIPVLLGWTPDGIVDRGAVEAAARGIPTPEGTRAWRVDVLGRGGARPAAATVTAAAHSLAAGAPEHVVHALGGHRLLLVGPGELPSAARAAGLRAWPEGAVPPRILDAGTVVIAAVGAAAGLARLLGARLHTPPGATGGPDSALAPKAAAALDAMEQGASSVVVHVGGPDEAAHERDLAAKVAVLERADHELIAPLAQAVRRMGGTLRVQPDHGCDPVTGAHDAEPAPCLTWPGDDAADGALAPRRLTERSVAALPVTDLTRRVALHA